jgi:argininosuccinate lyase
MLVKQGVISRASAAACLNAIDALDREKLRVVNYNPHYEDLFFYVQAELATLCGEEHAGQMHTARSRNDIDLTLYRMRLRTDILQLVEAVHGASKSLLCLAREHIATLMPAYTHTQPAQPTTLGHYLLAAIECFSRDLRRLRAAFSTVNVNPLGACAITTTGFPIDRVYTAALLGFEGLQLNSYGAIAATDYVTETAGAIATAMVNLGKLVQDLLAWSNPRFGYLRLSNAWVQISSIMPQKRNPVALEHTRILASRALAQAQGVFTATHNTPFGDIVDSEDDLQPLVFSMTIDAIRAFRLFGGLMSDCEIDVERLSERAHDDFLTVTELADTLVRKAGLSFHAAHGLVSQAVRELAGSYSPEAMVDVVLRLAPERCGTALSANRSDLLEALDPRHFVNIRNIPGGPAPAALNSALDDAEAGQHEFRAWMNAKQDLLEAYPSRMRAERETFLGTAPHRI